MPVENNGAHTRSPLSVSVSVSVHLYSAVSLLSLLITNYRLWRLPFCTRSSSATPRRNPSNGIFPLVAYLGKVELLSETCSARSSFAQPWLVSAWLLDR